MDKIFYYVFWLILFIIAIIMFSIPIKLTSNMNDNKEMKKQSELNSLFKIGDIVNMKIFGHKGMIINKSCWNVCTYSVRFSAIQSTTNTSVLGSDGAIDVAPISIVHGIREFELEKGI